MRHHLGRIHAQRLYPAGRPRRPRAYRPEPYGWRECLALALLGLTATFVVVYL